MRRHYIQISPLIKEYVLQITPGLADWTKALFDDLTEKGTSLTVVPLTENYEGPRIGLCGDTYYCQAGVDSRRNDCLFIFRAASAEYNLPRTVPLKNHVESILLSNEKHPVIDLDPVKYFFEIGNAGLEMSPSPAPLPLHTPPKVELSSQGRELLRKATDSLRQMWRPGKAANDWSNVADFIAAARRVWIRNRLAPFTQLTPRHESILKDMIRPVVLGSKERLQLMSIFNIEMLNAYVRAHSEDHATVFGLLEELSGLEIPPSFHAPMWASMLVGLDAAGIRRELHAVADQLEGLHANRSDLSVWEKEALAAIERIADENKDESLLELYHRSASDSEPLKIIASWARRLQFQDAPSPAKTSELLVQEEALLPVIHSISEPLPSLPIQIPEVLAAEATQDESLDRWILRMNVPDMVHLSQVGNEIHDVFLRMSELGTRLDSPRDVISAANQLTELQSKVADWLTQLPKASQLMTDYKECSDALTRARAILGEGVGAILQSLSISPSDLNRALDLFSRTDELAAMPSWIWRQELNERTEAALTSFDNLPEPFKNLLEPQVRERIAVVLDCFDQTAGNDAIAITLLPVPPHRDIDHVTQHVKESFVRITEVLAQLTFEDRTALLPMIRQGKIDVFTLQRQVEVFIDLSRRVSTDVCRQILQTLPSDASQWERDINLYLEAVSFFETQFGDAHDATFKALDAWAAKKRGELSLHNEEQDRTDDLIVDHNMIDSTKAQLVFNPHSELPIGTVSVPLLIETKQPRTYNIAFDIQVKSDQREAWPRDWPNPSPVDLMVVAMDWRKHLERNSYICTFKLTIPLRRGPEKQRLEKFETTIQCLDAENGRAISRVKTLRWDSIQYNPVPLDVHWPEGTDPHYVIDHPMGPQHRAQSILSRIQSGGSFAVLAPRRFGKSTLVEYLSNLAEETNIVITTPVLCTDREHFDGNRVDYGSIWEKVSANLQSNLGSSLVRTWNNDQLPDTTAFDHVRRAAKSKHKTAILLLFDEAQLLFPRQGGHSIGDQWKDRLERHWSRSDEMGMVPVLVGFIGLPSLADRAGANLMGLLRPIEAYTMNELDLQRLLRSVTRSTLHVTREARIYLAKSARNLYLLRTLLDLAKELLNREGRNWASFDDAVYVHNELKAHLRDGQDKNVSIYIRDALNEAETINDWKPAPAFPVALSLAAVKARYGQKRPGETMKSMLDLLNEWCASGQSDSISRPVYDEGRIQEHMRTLQEERQVLKDFEFTSELLEAWLTGIVLAGVPKDAAFQQALFQGAMVRIRIPDYLEPVGEGSQASIFRYTERNVSYAVRKARLSTEEDRIRFLETNKTLEILKRGLMLREAGSDYIFNLQNMGIAENDENCALQIYHWINGVDLGTKNGQLPAQFVVDVGSKLAQAVRLLHKYNILHRDIRPQNIILAEEDFKPILVDFGFARVLSDTLHSNIDNPCSAPEVRSKNPIWTKGADVFSLASTLLDVLKTSDPKATLLIQHLQPFLSKVEDRPDIDNLIHRLDKLATELHISGVRDDAWKQVQSATNSEDQSKSWFASVLGKFRPYVEAFALGVHSEQFERCREVASLTNQILEAFPAAERLSLAKLKGDAQFRDADFRKEQFTYEGISFLHALRNYTSHGNKQKRRIMADFKNPSDEDMVLLSRVAVKAISDFTQLRSLVPISEYLLGSGVPALKSVTR